MTRRLRTAVSASLVAGLTGGMLVGYTSFAAAAEADGTGVQRSTTCATIAQGAVGPAVATIQERMRTIADGEFGPLTTTAVKKWQRRHEVDPTGVVDAATWAALPASVATAACSQPVHGTGVELTCAHLHVGSTGPAVQVLQTALGVAVKPTFGSATHDAVTAAQAKAQLPVTGIVNPATWSALGLSGAPACMVKSAAEIAQEAIAARVTLLAAALLDRPDTTRNPTALAALSFARHQQGKPYQWGGVGPKSFDCSGLTMASYAHAGVTIPRVANDQYDAGRSVPLDHARAGDLMFYASDLTDPRSIYHVVMYLGDGTMIDAPRTGDVVGIKPLRTQNLLPVAVRVRP